MSKEELIGRIIGAYKSRISPRVGGNSELNRALIGDLEGVLEKHLNGSDQEGLTLDSIPKKISYSAKTGPSLPSGHQYTSDQVLDMYVEQFIEEHRTLPGAQRYLKSYFGRVGAAVEYKSQQAERGRKMPSEKTVRVKDVVQVPTSEAMGLHNLGAATIIRVHQFLEKHYDLGVGMQLEKYRELR